MSIEEVGKIGAPIPPPLRCKPSKLVVIVRLKPDIYLLCLGASMSGNVRYRWQASFPVSM
jgi:hypothetical protein